MGEGSYRFRFALRTDRGPIRRDNQDAAYADGQVLALADGMGGAPAGDVAAWLMITPFAGIDVANRSWDVVDHLRAATLRGEDAIAAHIASNPGLNGMGTTLTAVLLDGSRLGVLHAGDTRAYLHRGGVLYQLTHDDTFVQSLVDTGVLSPSEARVHPQRNLVLRALTGHGTTFSVANFEVHELDRLLLCSDGISGVLTDEVLAGVLTDPDLEACAELLLALALRGGSRDNLTCVVAEVAATGPEPSPRFAGAALAAPKPLDSGRMPVSPMN